MSKPEDIPQEVWDGAAQKASDYLWWVFECWPNTKLPAERLVERLTYDYTHAILAAQAEEREACALVADEFQYTQVARHIRKRGAI